MRTTWRTVTALALLAVGASGLQAAGDAALRKKALALNELTGEEPARAVIRELLRDPAAARKLLAEAAEMAQAKEPPFNLNAAYVLGRTAHGLKDYDASLTFYKLYIDQAMKLESGAKLVRAYGWLYDIERYDECVKACRAFLDLTSDDAAALKPAVQRRRVLALAKLGEVDRANRILDRMIDDNPHNWINVELRAKMLRELGKQEEAVKAYLDLMDAVKKDDALKKEVREAYLADVRYALSGVYIDLRQPDKATEQLKILLEKDPDNPSYNNDLGYVWADFDMNLAEAEKLIRRALDEDRKQRRQDGATGDEDRDHPAYLDSLGWVLYREKKYKEAKEALLKATADVDGQDVVLYDHLGDVLWALGEKSAAAEAWKKALEAAGSGKRDQSRKAEVEKKLKERDK
jgi:tetratricopeptide (TPR) repeat protein